MNIDKHLESLKKIRHVEAPSYLHAKILAQVSELKNAIAPKTWKISFAAAALILILLNVGLLINTSSPLNKDGGLKQFGNIMGLSISNDLYND